METNDLQKMISEVDPQRLDAYQKMFDRILLHTIAANVMPKKDIEKTIQFVDRIVKKTIDVDSTNRSDYLHSTKEGRLARMSGEPDGEQLRLDFLKTWEVAKHIITANLAKRKGNDNEQGSGVEIDPEDN